MDSFFLGHLLAPLIESGRATRRGLAETLMCAESQLVRLWLCRTPNNTAPTFRGDIERIAGYVGCDAARLATIVREASVIKALTDAGADQAQSMLLAARDRMAEEIPESDESDEEQ